MISSLKENVLKKKKERMYSKIIFYFETQSLKSNYPSRFEDPIIIPVQEFAWHQYLQEKKRVNDILGMGNEQSIA